MGGSGKAQAPFHLRAVDLTEGSLQQAIKCFPQKAGSDGSELFPLRLRHSGLSSGWKEKKKKLGEQTAATEKSSPVFQRLLLVTKFMLSYVPWLCSKLLRSVGECSSKNRMHQSKWEMWVMIWWRKALSGNVQGQYARRDGQRQINL